jgi:hypothetical protein
MKANQAMRSLLSETTLNCSLASSLRTIADSGFIAQEGCYVFRDRPGATNAKRANFDDCTGYECFINSLHIEDYDAERPFEQAVLFVMQVFRVWSSAQPVNLLTAIVSSDEFSVVTKFHIRRLGEQWLSEDIEGYEDPVLSIDSNEDITQFVK